MKSDRFESPIEDLALQREIETALAVDPSPEFAARLHARIEGTPAVSGQRYWWVFATAGGLGAIAFLFVLFQPKESARFETPRPPQTTVPTSARTNPPETPEPPLPGGVGARSRREHSKIRETATAEPEAFFAAEDLAALQRFVSAPTSQWTDLLEPLKLEPLMVSELIAQPLPEFDAAPIAIFVPTKFEPVILTAQDASRDKGAFQ